MKKVKGWVQCDLALNGYDHATEGGEVIYLQKHKELSLDVPAILIISDTQEPPKIWREEEVKAMLSEISTSIYRGKIGEGPQHTIAKIAERHGITL